MLKARVLSMPLEVTILDPEEIVSLEEVEECLSRITAYEREKNCKAGILLIQRKQFDGLYQIVSEQQAMRELHRPISRDTPEFGVKYYPHDYFRVLKEKLSGKTDVKLPQPYSRRHR